MFLVRRGAATLALTFVLLGSAISVNADTPWSNPSGTASYFDWENGHNSNTNLFGSPTLVGGNAFRFSPTDFRAESVDGVSGTANDIAAWDAIAHPGHQFSEIRIIEHGDYSISGTHEDNEVEVTTLLRADDNDLIWQWMQDFTTIEYTEEGTGLWDIDMSLDLENTFPPITDVHITLENNLVAISGGPGNVTWIEKKFAGAIIDVILIPEPSTLALIVFGGFALIRRRR